MADGIRQIGAVQGVEMEIRYALAHQGPHLFGVMGRPIASVAGFNYWAALQDKKPAVWDYEHLDHFLNAPKAYVHQVACDDTGSVVIEGIRLAASDGGTPHERIRIHQAGRYREFEGRAPLLFREQGGVVVHAAGHGWRKVRLAEL